MPYEIVKEGVKFVVKKKGTGKVMGKHNSRMEAVKQIQALHINEASEKLSQGYVIVLEE